MVITPKNKASAGRVLIKPRGEWDANVTYEMLDLVNHNGYAYLAKRTVVGIEPGDEYSTYWHSLLDIKGIVDKAIAESVADDVGNILEERFGDRLGKVEEKCEENSDTIENLEENTHTKDAVLSDETREMLRLEASATPDKAFASLYSKLSPIPSYMTFVGNVNATMSDAAFGKNNEDSILGIGRALQMYAKFKGDTSDNNYLAPYDKFVDIVENHKQSLIDNSTLYDLIKTSPYALDKLKNTSGGLPDIVLYDRGSTEYLDFDNATITSDDSTATNSVTTENQITFNSYARIGNSTNALVYAVPLLKNLPSLSGYKYLHVQTADSTIFAYADCNIYSLSISMGDVTVNPISKRNIDVTSNQGLECHIEGGSVSYDIFNKVAGKSPCAEVVFAIEASLPESGFFVHGILNVEKIWFSEA